ncbi:unnamed protein product [Leuciscus chuanchicus]
MPWFLHPICGVGTLRSFTRQELFMLMFHQEAMRSSPPCSAGAAGALGYLENINDSKQPEELPGEPDASQSMEQSDQLCGAMGFKNRPTRLTDSICSDQNGFTWMATSLKRTTGLSLRKKGASSPDKLHADYLVGSCSCARRLDASAAHPQPSPAQNGGKYYRLHPRGRARQNGCQPMLVSRMGQSRDLLVRGCMFCISGHWQSRMRKTALLEKNAVAVNTDGSAGVGGNDAS